MRTVLVLGGTAWLGREIARAALATGAAVTCLARGSSGSVPDGARLVAADRSLPGAYAAVAEQDWDEVVEISYDPGLVAGALAALGDRAAHWTLISSLSVYARDDEPGADEGAALVDLPDPIDPGDYAQAKVAAERASSHAVGDRLLTVRAGLIVGPGDGSDRFGYWVSRFATAGDGPVLAPELEDRWAQAIDVADLAAWVVAAGARGVVGPVNATGHPHSLASVLDAAAEVAAFQGRLVHASDAWLGERGVAYWAGPRSLPLWLPREAHAFARRSTARFLAEGGTIRGLDETLRRILTDERERGLDRERRSGLSRSEELELLG